MTDSGVETTLEDHIRSVLASGERASRYLSRVWLARATRTLRDARKRADLTQSELARRLGTTQSAVARLERDREGRYTMRRYADFLAACGEVPVDITTVPVGQARQSASINPYAPDKPIGRFILNTDATDETFIRACEECGEDISGLSPDARFCPHCGAELEDVEDDEEENGDDIDPDTEDEEDGES